MTALAGIERCLVEGCGIVAVESGYCFYHDRCPPVEITVTEAARVMHDSRYKKKERKRQVTETITEWEPAPQIDLPTVEIKALPSPVSEIEMVDSLDTAIDSLGAGRFFTGIMNLTLQSGGADDSRGTVGIYTDVNYFNLSTGDRAFLTELCDMIRAYARKHPKVPKLKTRDK